MAKTGSRRKSMPPQAPATPGSRPSAKQSTITPVKPESQTSKLYHEDRRAEALGNSLVGKIFTFGEATLASAADITKHFSAKWEPTEEDMKDFVGSDEWKKYAIDKETDQDQGFALIKTAARVFESSKSNLDAPLKRAFEQSFSGYFGYNAKSKAERKEPSGANLKPDVIMRDAEVDHNTATKPWSIVQAFIDLKRHYDTERATFNSAVLKLTCIFQDHYGYRRSHVVGATLYNTKMAHIVVDRSGVCISRPFDIVEDPKRFLGYIAGFLVLDEATLGFQSPDNQDSFKTTFDGTDYIVQRTPFVVPVFDKLVGRGTTCWRAKWAKEDERRDGWASVEDEEWPLVLKSSWQYVGRVEEGKHLERLIDEPGVPELVSYRKGITTDEARGHFKMGPHHHLFSMAKRAPATPVDVGSEKGRKARKTNSSRRVKTEAGRQAQATNKGADGKRGAGSADYVPAAERLPEYVARVEHLTLMMYAGQPYSTDTKQENLWAAICVALMTVNRLYQQNLLHRDISANNILIPNGKSFQKRKNPWGAVIDFDFASGTDSQPSASPERTGTLSHMAYLLVNRGISAITHYVWFDVESVFWFHYLACLEADEKEEYASACSVAMDGAADKKGRLYIDVLKFKKRFAKGAMAKSWDLLYEFAKFLRSSDPAVDPSEYLGYNMTEVSTEFGITLDPPSMDSCWALSNDNVRSQTKKLVSIFANEIAKNANPHDFDRDFFPKFERRVTNTDYRPALCLKHP